MDLNESDEEENEFRLNIRRGPEREVRQTGQRRITVDPSDKGNEGFKRVLTSKAEESEDSEEEVETEENGNHSSGETSSLGVPEAVEGPGTDNLPDTRTDPE